MSEIKQREDNLLDSLELDRTSRLQRARKLIPKKTYSFNETENGKNLTTNNGTVEFIKYQKPLDDYEKNEFPLFIGKPAKSNSEKIFNTADLEI